MHACIHTRSPLTCRGGLQKQIMSGGSKSDPMTRLAGIALGATGAHVLLAGDADGAAQRRAAKITAASSAVISGLAIQQIAGASATLPP